MSGRRALFDGLRDRARQSGRCPPVDLHMHTTWTDGAQSAAEMFEQARRAGLELVLFSEHARRTSTDWFARFAAEVRALPADPSCRALVGCEVKIDDFDGALDVAPEIVAQVDYVMASVHRFPGEAGAIKGTTGGLSSEAAAEIEFRLAMAALDNPATHILGHPFGMTVRRFGGAMPWALVETLVKRCAETGKAFEINARYHDEPRRLLDLCIRHEAPVSFGSNAHEVAEVGALRAHPGWTRSAP